MASFAAASSLATSGFVAPHTPAGRRLPILSHRNRRTFFPPPAAASASSSSSSSSSSSASPQQRTSVREEETLSFDVSSNCVNPVFRSYPTKSQNAAGGKAKILFLSEGDICRSVLAEAVFTSLIEQEGLEDVLECSSKGTRDYHVGEPPDQRTQEVANDFGLQVKKQAASLFDCAADVVEYDLIIVMDKFTASDAMKDVTLYETIDKENQYSWKVRRLGEFCTERKIDDIDDPLYGNTGDEEELEQLHKAALDIIDSCKGLMKFLMSILSSLQDTDNLKQGIVRSMGHMGSTDWLVPPMLQS